MNHTTTGDDMDTIGNPIRLRNGKWDGMKGTYWAWPVDGYYDIHHAPFGVAPDGSDVIAELVPTLAEARQWVKEEVTPIGMMGW